MELRNASYNPRFIRPDRRAKLKENLERVGFIMPVVWNERTGNIVGGHQRIAILDGLQGSSDYWLTVSVVDMDEKTEREQNVFLNNPAAMGEFDEDALLRLIQSGDDLRPQLDRLGFDLVDLKLMFPEDQIAGMFGTNAETAADDIAALERMKDKSAEMRELKKKARERAVERDDPEFYTVVVFRNRDEAEAFSQRFGLDPTQKYVDGFKLLAAAAGQVAPGAPATGAADPPAAAGAE